MRLSRWVRTACESVRKCTTAPPRHRAHLFYAQVRMIYHCRSEEYAEELMEEGLDVVHVLDVSKCLESNYGTGRRPAKKSARPAKKPASRRKKR